MNPADKFRKKVIAVQNKLASEILLILSALRVDDGSVLNVSQNYLIIDAVYDSMYALMKQAGYIDALRELAVALDEKKTILDAVFGKLIPDFNPIENSGTLAFNATKKEALRVLSEGAVKMQQTEFSKIMTESLGASTNYKDLVRTIKENISGSEAFGGRLESYAGTYARDSFSIAERSYSTAIANEFKLDWFRYVGGTIEDSREFCIERNDKVFHRSEIEAWVSEDWQGKNRATTTENIFNLCGGYNCIHTLVPISENQVPKEKIEEFANNN